MKMLDENLRDILKLFRELESAEFLDDVESRQTSKVFAIIELLRMKNKDKGFEELERLIDEIMELKEIAAEKYLKIGIAYMQSKNEVL